MSILGYDCDGKPIRAGDKLKYIGRDPAREEMKGVIITAVTSVIDLSKHNDKFLNFILSAEFGGHKFYDSALKKLDQDQKTIPWSECVWQPKAVTA